MQLLCSAPRHMIYCIYIYSSLNMFKFKHKHMLNSIVIDWCIVCVMLYVLWFDGCKFGLLYSDNFFGCLGIRYEILDTPWVLFKCWAFRGHELWYVVCYRRGGSSCLFKEIHHWGKVCIFYYKSVTSKCFMEEFFKKVWVYYF